MSRESIGTTGNDALATGLQLLAQLRETQAGGRLVIRLAQLSSGSKSQDVAGDMGLMDEDRLLVSKRAQEVSVVDDTQQDTSHKKLIFVVRANGAVVTANRSNWIRRRDNFEIQPGDTIVVPLDTDRIRLLKFWTSMTQIFYQGAIAVAAVKTFDN